ncbi:hypothetical protein GCM10020216_008150 [Nonomuraea helvata]
MTMAERAIGSRVKIVDMLHSPATTRAFASWLIGQCGTVVNILRNNTLALVKLDDGSQELLGGVRRWTIHWDDLLVFMGDAGRVTFKDGYRLGLSRLVRDAVQHAVQDGSRKSLCGKPTQPLPICGWSMPFSPQATQACPACVHLAKRKPSVPRS